MGWNMEAAISYLEQHGGRYRYNTPGHKLGNCAHWTTDAIEAGGIHVDRSRYAKDFGPALVHDGFQEIETHDFHRGDIAVIQPYPGGNPAGHMCMFDGTHWISDYEQTHGAGIAGMYPNADYRRYAPPFKIYRMS